MEIDDFRNIEFGLALIIDNTEVFYRIPVDDTVKGALVEMRDEFYRQFDATSTEPAIQFLPSEKYSSTEKLKANLNADYLTAIRDLYTNNSIPISNTQLSEIASEISYYFAIFDNQNGTKEVAIKRPNQFKGLLKKKNRLMRIIDDTLQLIPDDIFKLDNDFDFIVESDNNVNILHPAGFIYISNMDELILSSVVETVSQLNDTVTFVDFNALTDYISRSKRAAKLIASIKSREDLEDTSQEKLIARCASLRIDIRMDNGKICPHDDQIIDFLNVLDRRQFDIDITENGPEIYVASNRKKVR
jgi:hypothetical protein